MLIILGMSFTIVGIAKIEVKDYIHFIKIPFAFLVISIIMILINFSGDKSVLLHYIKVGNCTGYETRQEALQAAYSYIHE